jgi:hypothetical protein
VASSGYKYRFRAVNHDSKTISIQRLDSDSKAISIQGLDSSFTLHRLQLCAHSQCSSRHSWSRHCSPPRRSAPLSLQQPFVVWFFPCCRLARGYVYSLLLLEGSECSVRNKKDGCEPVAKVCRWNNMVGPCRTVEHRFSTQCIKLNSPIKSFTPVKTEKPKRHWMCHVYNNKNCSPLPGWKGSDQQFGPFAYRRNALPFEALSMRCQPAPKPPPKGQ